MIGCTLKCLPSYTHTHTHTRLRRHQFSRLSPPKKILVLLPHFVIEAIKLHRAHQIFHHSFTLARANRRCTSNIAFLMSRRHCICWICLQGCSNAQSLRSCPCDLCDSPCHQSPIRYEERILVFTLQGLVNRGGARLFFNAGLVDFDWPNADE